jgi:hypothetical protein
MSDDLAGFLLACIAEDEQRARDARWVEPAPFGHLSTVDDCCGCGEDHPYSTYLAVDPGRVLAECEAKRWIVERLMNHDDAGICQGTAVALLRTLAQPYAGHPDFREEWRA